MSYCNLISFDDQNLRHCLDYALGRITQHKDQRQLNKLALHATDVLKSETNLVTQFFCQQKETGTRSIESQDKPRRNSNSERDMFFKEREQLVLDNEEIYINDLLNDYNHPNLDNLFKFIEENRGGLNLTAAHYFTEIVTALLKKEPEKMLSYIYARKYIIDFLIRNCDFHSIKNLLSKVLNLNKDEGKTNVNFKFFKHRFTLYNRLLKEIASTPTEILNNLMEIFIQLLKEEENVVDAEYFVERLFEEQNNFKRLIEQISKTQSQKLVELVELILNQVFVKNSSEFWKSKKSQLNEDLKKSNYVKTNGGVFALEEEKNRIIEDSIVVEVHIDGADEEKKENQPTAETSNDAIKNLDLELYDPEEMKRLELLNALEAGLPAILSVLGEDGKNTTMQPDGLRISFSNAYKISIVRLLKLISKMEYRSVKDILIQEEALLLFLVNL